MKRRPECYRVETDDTLVYCRGDGAALISDSVTINGEAGTARFDSGPMSGGIATSILSRPSTTPDINGSIGPTTALPLPPTQSQTRELTKPTHSWIHCVTTHALRKRCAEPVSPNRVNLSTDPRELTRLLRHCG